ncbi:nucleoporin NSP1-like [Ixodes scapularis]|uniref:nucleoporin NSP1-like n=1 Tax=Ixodes scapularis TaxID=6945 RepID=UPI001C38A9F7|nr:nucleoporin NSP1-like [Ixodes scapularis]
MSSFASGWLGASASEAAPPSTTSGCLIGNAAQDTKTTQAFGQPSPSTMSSFVSGGFGALASEAPSISGSLFGNAAQDTNPFETTTSALLDPWVSYAGRRRFARAMRRCVKGVAVTASGGLGASVSGTTSGSLIGNATQDTSQFKTMTPAFGLQPAPSTTSSLGSMGLGAPASSTTSGSLTGNASQGTSQFKTTTPAFGLQPAPSTTSSLGEERTASLLFGSCVQRMCRMYHES